MFSSVNSFSAFDFNQINNRFLRGGSGNVSSYAATSALGVTSSAFGASSSADLALGASFADAKYVTLPFFYNGKPASESFDSKDIPSCVMSLAAAGSLRYNSGKENPERRKFLASVLPEGVVPVPVYLIHSKRVYVAEPDVDAVGVAADGRRNADVRKDAAAVGGVCLVAPDSDGKRFPVGAEGDGVITSCRSFAPVVTAADCMPVFLWDSGTGAFGICHSGWKGTGIAAEAVALMGKRFGAKPEDICVILGPHIHECCYTVDAERAAYFSREFSPDCCEPVAPGGGSSAIGAADGGMRSGGNTNAPNSGGLFRLSLARANIVSLTKAGIKPENILHCTDCTSCFSLPASGAGDATVAAKAGGKADAGSTESGASKQATSGVTADMRFFPYGSFRRQTAHLPEGTPLEERFKVFSAMAAVIGYIAHN